MDIITIELGLPRFPRVAYLVRDLSAAEQFLKNAFVFRGVHWEKIHRLVAKSTSPELHEEISRARVTSVEQFFQEVFPFTLIPFSTLPTPRGHRIKVNELERLNAPPPKKGVRRPHSKWYGGGWPQAPHAILFEAMDRMGVKVENRLYDSPCLTCLKLFEHIAGKCALRTRAHNGDLFLCHMDLLASSDVFPCETEHSHPSTRPLPSID